MPELPDVEGFKAYFDSTGLGKEISGVSAPDARTLKDVSIQSLGRKLKGTVFAGTRRWGKYLFGEVDGNGHLVLHFGMTGNLVCYKKGSDKPRFESVVFDFKDGYR
ncbi:MAG: DNA-formamidopyrimidine glycosylase family protein, partial [Verrucomicrobiota bacterium]